MNKIICIDGIAEPVEIVRSKRKTLSLQVADDCHIIARSPTRLPEAEVQAFIRKNVRWLNEHIEKVKSSNRKLSELPCFTPDDIKAMSDAALKIIPERVRHYANIIGVDYGRITIRCQKTKWGSCSSAGNLNFNCLLMAAPSEVLNSVVVHELCHRLYMDHSANFYREVYKVFPEYDKWNKWLKINGKLLIRRMLAGK